MTEPILLDPRAEEILRDIAADPNSCLLRLQPDDLARSLRRGELPDRAGTTGLPRAERELLRAHRAEVALSASRLPVGTRQTAD
jgi:hypothetical protein